jgi:hypothetical protein
MEIDTARVRELLDKRDAIDAELAAIFLGKERKPLTCSICGGTDHTARKCPQKT